MKGNYIALENDLSTKRLLRIIQDNFCNQNVFVVGPTLHNSLALVSQSLAQSCHLLQLDDFLKYYFGNK